VVNNRYCSKNVCPYEHIEEVIVKEPCLKSYTKYVRTRKIGCNGLLATCTVREPKWAFLALYVYSIFKDCLFPNLQECDPKTKTVRI
jgi:hypothetical protein